MLVETTFRATSMILVWKFSRQRADYGVYKRDKGKRDDEYWTEKQSQEAPPTATSGDPRILVMGVLKK